MNALKETRITFHTSAGTRVKHVVNDDIKRGGM